MRLRLCICLLSAIALRTGGPIAQTQGVPAGTGLVAGQIVDAQTGRGVPEATVQLRQFFPVVDGPTTRPGAEGYTNPFPKVVADDEGRFYFAGVADGRFQIDAQKAGYLNLGGDQSQLAGAAQRFELTSGERRTNLRLPLWKAGVIAGSLTDERGDPVVGAGVRILRRFTRNGWPAFSPITTLEFTDDRGEFRMSGLSPGAYLLAVPGMRVTIPLASLSALGSVEGEQGRGVFLHLINGIFTEGSSGFIAGAEGAWYSLPGMPRQPAPKRGGPLLTYPPTFYPSTSDLAQAELITLGPGEQFTAAHIRLFPVTAVPVSGVVVGTGGNPPAGGTSVKLLDASFAGVLPEDFSTAAAPVDQRGEFAWVGVPPGRYLAALEQDAAQRGQLASASVIVGSSPVTDVVLTTQPLATVSGQIVFEGNEAVEREVTASQVTAQSAMAMPAPPIAMRMDPSGAFRLTLRPGRYFLTPGQRGPWTVKSITHAGRNLYDAPFEMGGEPISDVVITYAKNATAELKGTASLENGSPAAGSMIVAFPADPALRGPGAQPPHRYLGSVASLTGAFSLQWVPPGQYLVAAIMQEDAEDWRDPAVLDRLSRLAQSITLTSGGSSTVRLKVTPLSVREPAEEGHGPFVAEQSAQVPPVPQRDVPQSTIVTPGRGRIEGMVVSTDDPSQPLKNVHVLAQLANRRFGLTVPSDDEGRFVFEGLPAGEYRLTADKPGWLGIPFGASRPGALGTTLPLADAQQRSGLTMRMARGAVLTGVVTNAQSAPMPGVRVEALRHQLHALTGQMQLQPVGSDVADDLGVFRIHSLRPGDYVLRATDPEVTARSSGAAIRRLSRDDVDRALALGARPASTLPETASADFGPVTYPDAGGSAMLRLKAGQELRGLNIVMTPEPLSTVRGSVRRADGLPFSVGVSLFRGGPEAERLGLSTILIAEARANAEGRFAFRPVPAGTYLVRVRSDGGMMAASATVVVSGPVDLALELQPAVLVRGRVVLEGTDPATVPVPPVQLRLLPSGTGSELNGPEAKVAPNGTFAVTGVFPGRYFIGPLTMPSPEWTLRESVVNGRASVDASLTIEPGQDVQWELHFTKEPTRLTGTFTNATGRSASEYTLVVFAEDRTLWRPTSRSIRTTRPNADGTFTVLGLPPGTYHLAAVTDIDNGDQYTAELLDTLVPSAISLVIRDKATTTQDIRVGGG